ncbi:MAG: ATP--guanido phosphotransferase [Ruminococcaceae bacterium]|nr:ATP--guanido phosphotransferase [Oscillospiraceae bacterium]
MKTTNWYTIQGSDNDVVVSTRVRLARNLQNYPFDPLMTEDQAAQICSLAKEIYTEDDGWEYTDFGSLTPTERRAYAEKHLVSREFAESRYKGGLLSKNSVHIMVLEEDHLRLQSIYPGFALEEAYRDVSAADELLDNRAQIAYNEKFGYLTHCPTNLGTGMRASVMLFLPACSKAHLIRGFEEQLGKIGLTIRGMTGEGSKAEGRLFQISNQITLGVTEEETIHKLSGIVEQIVKQERELRGILCKGKRDENLVRNQVRRAYGTLLYATLLQTEEMVRLYEDIRLGAALGMIENLNPIRADEMLFSCMPNTLMANGECKTPEERDEVRANRARAILTGETGN